jgi:hypothetical protein
VSTVAILLSLFVPSHAEAATEAPLRLVLYVYDYAGVAPDARAAAAEITRQIYAAIGVDIVWVDRCPVACHIAFSREAHDDTTDVNLMMLTILPDGMTSREFSADVMGGAPERSNVATAYFGRIRAFAFERNFLPATLLGHVVAHELGHLLLREGHARQGLMRARWVDDELLQARVGRLGFTVMQGSRIRSRLGVMQNPPNRKAAAVE